MPKTKTMLTQIEIVMGKLQPLFDWSKNFEPGKTPASLFLDIIGYSDEILGAELVADKTKAHEFMGYTEYCMLGKALQVYGNASHLVVYEACNKLIDKEQQ
tara:strand:+ start:288 stop:590 length:303 start_codon:yes stop_codon:yes gene_type:complete